MGMHLAAGNPIYNNVTEGATLYAQLASVLCGFAFTALVLLVTTSLSNSDKAQKALAATGRALIAAFLGLLIMSVGYAALSSNPRNDYLALSENTILVVGFAGVGVLIIYTVVLMLDSAGSLPASEDDAGRHSAPAGPPSALWVVMKFARGAACLMNWLVMGMVYDTISVYENVRYVTYRSGASVTLMDAVSWAMLFTELMVAVWAMWTVRRPVPGPWAGGRARAEGVVPFIGLAFPVVAAFGYLVADILLQDKTLISPVWVYLILFAAFAITTSATVQLALTRPGAPRTRQPEAALVDAPSGGTSLPWVRRIVIRSLGR